MKAATTSDRIAEEALKILEREGEGAVSMRRVAQAVGITPMAIYHHFSNKKSLFQAVAEELENEILAEGMAAENENPWLRFQSGFERLIDFCAAPDVQRIIFIEAPQVMGPDAWRKIELRYAYGALHETLPKMIEAGIIKPYPVELIARTLLALLRETSAEVARTKGNPRVRAQIGELARGVMSALAAHIQP